MPAYVAAVVHPSEKNTLRVRVLRQLAWHSNGAGNVNTCWNLVVQTLMWALIIEDVAKVIEAALLFTPRAVRHISEASSTILPLGL